MAILQIEKGKTRGLRFEVPEAASPTVIGRDSSADVPVDDERISRQHARILRRRGQWLLEDLGSRNGILLGGRQVREARIKDGEVFQIGSTVFLLLEGERVDPLAGKELEGFGLERLLRDEAGVLSYQARQLAMDRGVRIDVVHPRWPLNCGDTP